jgi:hypothetical protein
MVVMSPDVLSLQTFCPHGHFVPRMLCLQMFCSTDVLCAERFVPPDILSCQTFYLSECFVPGCFVSGRLVSGRFVWAPNVQCVGKRCLGNERKEKVIWVLVIKKMPSPPRKLE